MWSVCAFHHPSAVDRDLPTSPQHRLRPPVQHRALFEGGLLAMGGLWESWRTPEGEIVRSFCVITTSPNAIMAPIHDRMPVILAPQDFQRWLDPTIPGVSLPDLLVPPPADSMEAWPVSRKVSNAANEGADLINPVDV